MFFPLPNSEFDNLNCPNTHATAEELQRLAAGAIDGIVPGSLTASVDGHAIPGLDDASTAYRSPSRWFTYVLPRDNIGQFFNCTFRAGTTPPRVDHHPGAIADGVYVMLAPLPRGRHVLHFGGRTTVGPFLQDITYTITVR